MKALIDELLKIEDIDEKGLVFYKDDPSLSSIFTVQGGSIKKSFAVTRKYLELLRGKEVHAVSIDTNRETLPIVRHCAVFKPMGEVKERPLAELYGIASEYQIMNQNSSRRRGVHIMEDIFSLRKNFVTGEHELLIEYGGELTPEAVKRLSEGVLPGREVLYADKEHGVLTFFPGGAASGVEASLGVLFKETGLQRQNATTIDEARHAFLKGSPRVVILSDLNRTTDSKAFLMEIEKLDPFFKYMDWGPDEVNSPEWSAELLEGLYGSGYTANITSYEESKQHKDPLPEDLNLKINLLIKKLGAAYSYPLYIDTAFTLRRLSAQFNVSFFRQLLAGVHNRFRAQ